MQFVELTEDEFEEFSQNHIYSNFWQSVEMAHLRKWNGWNYTYVGVKEENIILAATMLSYRKIFLNGTFVQAVRGFLLDYHNVDLFNYFQSELKKYLSHLHCIYFKVDPYLAYKERDENGDLVSNGFDHSNILDHFIQLGYQHAGFVRGNDNSHEPNWMFVKDLAGENKENLLKEFDHQTRWTINKTLRMGIKIREITIHDLPEFKKIMEHTGERREFADHSMHYYQGLFEIFSKKNRLKAVFAELDLDEYVSKLMVEKKQALAELDAVEQALMEVANSKKFVKKKRVIIEQIELLDKKLTEAQSLKKQGNVLVLAAATFILFGDEVMYLYSGAYEEYMRFNASYAIQWHMINHAITHGYNTYNFYGISGLFGKQDEGYGVYEFKKGFKGHVVELIGDLYYYPRPLMYKTYECLRACKHMIKKR